MKNVMKGRIIDMMVISAIALLDIAWKYEYNPINTNNIAMDVLISFIRRDVSPKSVFSKTPTNRADKPAIIQTNHPIIKILNFESFNSR
jgi:hypothetical protein